MTKFRQLFGRIYRRTKYNFFIIYSRTWLSSYLATAGYLAKNYKVYVVCIMQKQPSRSVLGKGALEICIKFTGEHPCRSASSIRLLCSPVSLLYIFRTHFQLWTTTSDYVKTGIWSKSVINKLQFDERNKSLEC